MPPEVGDREAPMASARNELQRPVAVWTAFPCKRAQAGDPAYGVPSLCSPRSWHLTLGWRRMGLGAVFWAPFHWALPLTPGGLAIKASQTSLTQGQRKRFPTDWDISQVKGELF